MAKPKQVKVLTPEVLAEMQTPTEVVAAAPDLIDFNEPFVPPVSLVDPDTGALLEAAPVKNVKVATQLSEAEQKERDAAHLAAEQDDLKRDFTVKVMEARRPLEPVVQVPEVCSRVQEQTKAEMAAGAALNKYYAELHAGRNPPQPDKGQPTNVEVFRPDNYDEYKASFRNQAQSTDKGRGSRPLG